MSNNTSLTPFSTSMANGAIPVLTIDSLSVSQTIPLSLFPDFVNDAGVQAFGGARYISVFEDGSLEGAGTLITPETNTLIANWGGIVLPNPDPTETYRVRLRFRSELNDVNYRDRVVVFRVVTPLMVPFELGQYDDTQVPDIVYDTSTASFQFSAPAGFTAMPTGEITLHNGLGGLVLPNTLSTSFGDEANTFLAARFAQLSKGAITIDFSPDGTVESYMRCQYWVTTDPTTSPFYTVTHLRRSDFSNWGRFDADVIDFVEATVDYTATTPEANIRFLRGLHSLGPRFDAVYVAGRLGSQAITPTAVIAGATIDVTDVVDFNAKSHLSQTGLADKFLLLITVQAGKTLLREIPLRPKGQYDIVGEDGITNVLDTFSGATPPVQPLFIRTLFEDYLEVPNLATQYDPAAGLLQTGASQPYPRYENIQVFEENAVVASVTYNDAVDLFNQMYSIPMPDIGVEKVVLDRRQLRRDGTPFTAISKTAAYLRVVMDINIDGTPANIQTLTCYYEMNPDGQPQVWKQDATLFGVSSFDTPTLSYQKGDRTLTIAWPTAPTNIDYTTIKLLGDLGEITDLQTDHIADGGAAFAAGTSSVISSNLVTQVATDLAEMIEVTYTTTSGTLTGTFKTRIGLFTADQMIIGDETKPIGAVFTGDSIVFTDLTHVELTGDGRAEVMLVGDGAPIIVRDAQLNVPEMINFQGASTLGSNNAQTHIDLHYPVDVGGSTEYFRYRVYNSFFDARSGNPRTLAIAPNGPVGSSGLDYQMTNFSAPSMKFNLNDNTVIMLDDGRNYNFSWWTLRNLSNNSSVEFSGPIINARKYAIGQVLQGVEAGQSLLFVARHRNGTERTFTVQVSSTSHLSPKRITYNLGL